MTKELILKLSLIANVALLAACAALAACSTATTGHMLDNLQGCTRHYDGTVSGGMTGGQFAGTVKVDCTPPLTATPQPTTGVTPPA